MKKTVAFSKNAANIFFHILTDCNLKCKHCYINRDQHGTDALPIEVIESQLEVFAKRTQNANVIFLGGEPTLHPDLPRAVKKANALGFDSVTIDTNGYLFHDILSKIEPDEADFISFSLDGASPETNDPIRGKGSFKRCVAGMKAAADRGFSTSLIYTASRANIHELKQMPPLLATLGIKKFFIQFLGARGNSSADNAPNKNRTPDQNRAPDQKNQTEKTGASGKIRASGKAKPGEKARPAEKTGTAKSIKGGGQSQAACDQVSKEKWFDIAPQVAQEVARLGIPVCHPKVFLEPGETFECAGQVADNYFVFPNHRVYRCPLCEDFPLHSMEFDDGRLKKTPGINETDLFSLTIPEGCVMNRLISPENLKYADDGSPEYRIACCMLKEETI